MVVDVNERPMKRIKRRVTVDLNDFFTFPAVGSAGVPFRTCVKEFLSKNAFLPPPSSFFPHLLTWQILLRAGDITAEDANGCSHAPAIICVDIVEEDVSRSTSIYCDQCRVVGWSSNPVCCKRYHFIIKADGNSMAGYNKSCPSCADPIHLSDSRCKSCNHVLTAEDVEDWMYHQLEDTTHLLHGVIHSNGFGHLLRVNGRESGSLLLSGRHIMDFWDRLCISLGVRKVSVTDVSKKYGLEFRLLHAVANGQPWYGVWGYEFGAGSFGLTNGAYKTAIETLSSIPLSIFSNQGRKPRTRLQDLIAFYQSLCAHELLNISDLFRYLLSLIHDSHKSSSRVVGNPKDAKKHKPQFDSRVLCAWNNDDIVRVEEAMFRVLRAVSGSHWVSWRSLKGTVCKVGSPELLDFCLKDINGRQATDGLVVNARCSPESGAMEFRLEQGIGPLILYKSGDLAPRPHDYPSQDHLLQDLRYLYESLLCPQTISYNIVLPEEKRDLIIRSATTILDCKQFLKDFQLEKPLLMMSSSNSHEIHLLCEVDLQDLQYNEEYAAPPNPPTELLILPSDSTVSDLKLEASRAFQDVYFIFKRFIAEEVIGYAGVNQNTQVKLLLGSAVYIKIKGKCMGKSGLSRFRMEKGLESWTVDCYCGTRDDDGERMVACDSCGIWQHTRCCGICDSDVVPCMYICHRCNKRYGGAMEVVDTICNGKGKGRVVGPFDDMVGLVNNISFGA